MSTLVSQNPATLEDIGSVPITAAEDVKKAVARARQAQDQWYSIGFSERAEYLLRARKYLFKNISRIAETITRDNGKPLVESVTAEVYPVAEAIHYFAHNSAGLLAPRSQGIGIMGALRRSSIIEYIPHGVVGIISPWNYPFSIPASEAVMALMAGNSVVLKPSSVTPLVGQAIADMFAAAEMPGGVFQHVPGNSTTGEALLDAGCDKMLFTGSVGVGKKIMARCANTLTPCVLELGGKDPMIVRADADIDVASSGAVWGAFTNCGQTCAAVERVYVHKDIFDKFVEAVVEKTKALVVGNGLDDGVDVGPLTTQSQLETVEAQVADARNRGADILTGGERVTEFPGYFYWPTVITGVDHSFQCMREETFGPLLPIMRYDDDAEAIRLANDSEFGLTASVWTKDIAKGHMMARELNAGTVMINEAVYTYALCRTPWGGVKDSGIGRSHAREGLLELVRPLHIHTNRWVKKSMWWYSYSRELYEDFQNLAKNITGNIIVAAKALPTLLKLMIKKKR
jgi:acyl-CoA reductase-like NAD-dependent aldehyde dehydrogenase